jgi:hypothetical protein
VLVPTPFLIYCIWLSLSDVLTIDPLYHALNLTFLSIRLSFPRLDDPIRRRSDSQPLHRISPQPSSLLANENAMFYLKPLMPILKEVRLQVSLSLAISQASGARSCLVG